MKYIAVLVLLFTVRVNANAQVVTEDRIPPGNGCATTPTYKNGLNITISVTTSDKYSDPDLEQTLARDISRFKDTNLVRANSDPVIPIGKRPIAFEVNVFWAEVKLRDGRVISYVGSYFIEETCAVFEHPNSSVPGFMTHLQLIQSPLSDPERDKLIDRLEKSIYDGLMTIAKRRRARSD